jgi:hypothetical protein
MARTKICTSRDGLLRFVVSRDDDGDVTLGFEGFPWHTHADLLIGYYGPTPDAAVERFVEELLSNRAVIAIYRQDQTISDVCISDDPKTDLEYKPEHESIEFRLWDGTEYTLTDSATRSAPS